MIATEEMKEYFTLRTRAHLFLVNKWSNKISQLNHPLISRPTLDLERDEHDELKWLEPEYTPYLFITWNYYCKRKGIPFEVPQEIKDKMHEATFHHIKRHKHHPEYWDESMQMDGLNKDDRDRPTEGKLVNATEMPITYVAAMVADWCAMSEELGTNSPRDWADKNINIRWKFTEKQSQFIYDLIGEVWP